MTEISVGTRRTVRITVRCTRRTGSKRAAGSGTVQPSRNVVQATWRSRKPVMLAAWRSRRKRRSIREWEAALAQTAITRSANILIVAALRKAAVTVNTITARPHNEREPKVPTTSVMRESGDTIPNHPAATAVNALGNAIVPEAIRRWHFPQHNTSARISREARIPSIRAFDVVTEGSLRKHRMDRAGR